jgi:hypothetical protein
VQSAFALNREPELRQRKKGNYFEANTALAQRNTTGYGFNESTKQATISGPA